MAKKVTMIADEKDLALYEFADTTIGVRLIDGDFFIKSMIKSDDTSNRFIQEYEDGVVTIVFRLSEEAAIALSHGFLKLLNQ